MEKLEQSIKPPRQVYICFFIAELRQDGTFTKEGTYPSNGCNDKDFKQYQNFCFPIVHNGYATELKSQHFTFMLTDIDTSRKYGFCKMIETNSKFCYCFISEFPWFEIFYKCLNCLCTLHMRKDKATLHSIIEKLYGLPIPKANDIVSLTTSLTFAVPDKAALPSIPENRNMMEYISTTNPKNMIEIFAALMFERRIIFTSSNLSVISGCVFASESLIRPLSWQHIFIPLLHRHIVDYCAAPMPFIIGMHSTLYKTIVDTPALEGVVVVNIDENTVFSPYDDAHKLPGEAMTYLRSQLGKPNISVGTNLPRVFLHTQAILFGGYRVALKFRMGETISFDEDKFIISFKPGGKRCFAEELIHLQSFRQFIEKRLHMLNHGIGFHDLFEREVSELQHEYDDSMTVYKEWIARASDKVLLDIKANMKSARSSAKQGMKEMKNALKSVPKEGGKELSLSENIAGLRPPRPPRPPPPKTSKTVTRFKVIDGDEPDNTSRPEPTYLDKPVRPEPTYLDKPTESNIEELLVDLTFDTSPKSESKSFLNSPVSSQKFPSPSNDSWSQELFNSYDLNMSQTDGGKSVQLANGFVNDAVASNPAKPPSIPEEALISFD